MSYSSSLLMYFKAVWLQYRLFKCCTDVYEPSVKCFFFVVGQFQYCYNSYILSTKNTSLLLSYSQMLHSLFCNISLPNIWLLCSFEFVQEFYDSIWIHSIQTLEMPSTHIYYLPKYYSLFISYRWSGVVCM